MKCENVYRLKYPHFFVNWFQHLDLEKQLQKKVHCLVDCDFSLLRTEVLLFN